MDEKIGIVFLNGAGLNSSIWNDLKQELDHPILNIDFPNRKLKNHPKAKLTFNDYVSAAISEIKKWGKDNFIIVGHSIGACVGLKIAEQFKVELAGFVAIGSVIPKSGQSFVSSLPFPQKLLLPILLRLFGTMPPKKTIENELCSDLTPEKTLKIVEEFTPEAKGLYTTKITFDLPVVKRLYIKLTNDKSIPTDLQDDMAKNLNATDMQIIHSGHLPMLSKSTELAKILSDFIYEIKPHLANADR